jgi:hypothetical protein
VTPWIAAAVSVQLLDTVALVNALPDEGLPAGSVGTIVPIFVAGSAFEVEFTDDYGGPSRSSCYGAVRYDPRDRRTPTNTPTTAPTSTTAPIPMITIGGIPDPLPSESGWDAGGASAAVGPAVVGSVEGLAVSAAMRSSSP